MKSRSDIQELQERLDGGDLSAADDETKNTVRYWVARLCASDPETLNVAREFREEIRIDNPHRDLSIVDALIVEAEGNPDEAIRILRDRDDPDARTALFGVIARARGSAKALDTYSDRIDAGDTELFTVVGWRIWAGCMAEVGAWEEAAQLSRQIGRDLFYQSRSWHLLKGLSTLSYSYPRKGEAFRPTRSYFAGITPKPGRPSRASPTSVRQSVLRPLERFLRKSTKLNSLESVTDWQRWLELMDPKG